MKKHLVIVFALFVALFISISQSRNIVPRDVDYQLDRKQHQYEQPGGRTHCGHNQMAVDASVGFVSNPSENSGSLASDGKTDCHKRDHTY